MARFIRPVAAALSFVPLLLVLGCVPEDSSNPESAAVSRLSRQGFKLVSDGRGTNQPSAMRYTGAAEQVLACNGKQSNSVATKDGQKAKQTGTVQAYVIIGNDGARTGLYTNALVREVRSPSGKLVARQIENIRFKPTEKGRFRNGLTCQARG